ncbi:DUF3299 domain-containing protein [Shimia sp.]|jgi:hypothetical protein|uniref:DUF3299 domain-containing protein n=1 Tax=unclassified Shimia TaxID=2630038 RepID=UPI0025D21AD8|nr:DUF3299 domain-containing protein [Shimia sp.]MCH2069148.1 DUF3299 domain-containing protein [Shimia sp.]
MPTRRRILASLAALSSVSALPAFAGVVDLDWKDLVPEGDTGKLLEQLRGIGVVEHGQLTTGFSQEEAKAVTEAFNGQTVRLPGFVVPLDFGADGVKDFILAPFVGACIHVPPPPANQLVLVAAKKPYALTDLYEPVEVTGEFGTAATATGLAEVGYTLTGAKVRKYKG